MGFSRVEHLERLAHEEFDLVVIGGGITGAGAARDAAMRGLRVALVEARDFTSGTSSKSSKLLHGGIRYLEQFHLGLVFEASHERRLHSQFLAPHLSRPEPFLIPVYPWSPHGMAAMAIGVYLYDALAMFRNHGTRVLSEEVARKEEPLLASTGLKGAVVYHDVVMDDSRITIENIRSAMFHGAVVANYAFVRGFEKDSAGKINGVWVKDTIDDHSKDFLIKTKMVLNATGPWCDYIRRLDRPDSRAMLRPTKGVHLILPAEKLGKKHAFVLTAAKDNRVFFSIPWFGRTLVGTTDTDYNPSADGELNDIHANQNEIDYLFEGVKRTFPEASVSDGDIISTFAGLRPLVAEHADAGPSQISREHRIWVENSGLLCIAGGKYTTYRTMAKQAIDIAVKNLQKDYPEFGRSLRPCLTSKETIVFPFTVREREFYRRGVEEYISVLGATEVAHLQIQYGGRWQCVANLAMEKSELRARIIPEEANILAEIEYAREQEMAVHFDDYLRRRSQLALRTPLQPHFEALQKAQNLLGKDLPPLTAADLKKWQGRW